MIARSYFKMLPNYSKKAQMEITETIIVLLIFIILLSIGLFYYYNYYFSSLGKKGLELSESKATTLTSIITSMPEISCSYEQNCLDLTKLFAFKQLIAKNQAYYSKIFKNKAISIEFIYPKPLADKECIINLPCSFFNLYTPAITKHSFTLDSPVLIYSPYNKQYTLAKLKIISYT